MTRAGKATIVSKLEVLRSTKFGNQVAEEEKDTLRDYFVETNPWKQVYGGDIDIVYGVKGAGKSAIYVLIQKHERELSRKGIILVPAENLRGDPAFAGLIANPPTSEREFENLWRLFFMTLIGRTFFERSFSGPEANMVQSVLRDANLLPSDGMTLNGILKTVQDYVRRYTRPHSIEGTVTICEGSGAITGVTGRIIFDEADAAARTQGKISVAQLFNLADLAIKRERKKIWLLLDRLDVAFDESADLERNALRALFRAYRTIRSFDHILLKIFLRTDIWSRISDIGFREATHLSRDLTLKWDPPDLQNLIVRRLVNNPLLNKLYGVDKKKVLQSTIDQDALFYRVFPRQVETGERQSTTMDWIIKRTSDGTGLSAPREVVLFLNELRDVQIQRLERGEPEPSGDTLFDRSSFKQALPKVSEYRTTKVLYSEYPELKPEIEALRSKKSEHQIKSLSSIWNVSMQSASEKAHRLVEVGFFERRTGESITYWVPFIYRPYLNLVQGRADVT